MTNPTKGIGALQENSGLMENKGTNYLLAIAIDEYTHLPTLYNPVRAAKAFIELMTDRYRFEPENVVRIFNGEAKAWWSITPDMESSIMCSMKDIGSRSMHIRERTMNTSATI
ncbi:MAG: hypothetical protein IPL49_10825 [Saprospirales bacterium]|nr:hypothetical protein [Saprospirales bacterium]